MQSTNATIIGSREDSPFKPAVVLGQGLPNDINGQPVAYFWKEMLPLGRYRDAQGKAFEVTPQRIGEVVACFNRAKAKGYRPFLPAGSHSERKKNYGFIQDVRVNANGSLEGLHQFIGEDAIREAARNRSSVCILRDVTDEHGEHYSELIDHNAILPDPQLSGLADFQPFNPALAASRGQTISAAVLELAAPEQETAMDLTALRKAIGAADTVSDADVLSQAAAKLGSIPQLEQARTTAETERDAARTELSRRPAQPEFPAVIASGSVRNLHKQVELMAREGSITGAQAEAAKKLIGTPEQPNVLALSRTGADHPAEAWLEVLALSKSGVDATGAARSGVQELSRQPHDHSAVTNPNGTADAAKLMTEGRQEGEAWKQEQLSRRGHAA
jgi:hypothetical protein